MYQVFSDRAKIPEASEKLSQGGWVNSGDNNLYKQWLAKLYYESPIHGGIINAKVNYIVGGGIKYEGSDKSTFEAIRRNGQSRSDLDELIEFVCLDNEIFNDFYLKCTKNILNGQWYFDILDSELMRNDENGIYYYYSEDWSTSNQSAEKTRFKRYTDVEYINPDTETEAVFYVKGRAKQFIVDDKKKLTSNIYAVPTYSGAIVSICSDIEMSNFHYAESVNGFTGGAILSMKSGIPEEEDRKEFEKEVRDAAQDRSKKGGFTIVYSEGEDGAPEILMLSGNDLDKRYLETQKHIIDEVMIGHSVISKALFSISSAGSLGSNQEIQTGYGIFKKNYAKKKQGTIARAFTYINRKLNGLQGDIMFNENNLQLEAVIETETSVAEELNKMSPLVANTLLGSMTLNEKRALGKLPPIQGGDALPGTPTQTAQFKSQDSVLNQFLALGVPRSSVNFIKSRKIEDFSSLEAQENEFISLHYIEKFAKVSAIDKKILGLLKGGATFSDIIKETGKSPEYIAGKMVAFEKSGLTEKQNGKTVLTESGQNEVESIEFRILYTYEKRDDAPDLVPGGQSREFCRELLAADKAFTRQEIESINNDEGSSVWLYRGGWYHNPETDENERSCRHFWKMNIVA